MIRNFRCHVLPNQIDALLDETVLSVDAQYLTLACPWQAFVHLRCATCVSPSECSLPPSG